MDILKSVKLNNDLSNWITNKNNLLDYFHQFIGNEKWTHFIESPQDDIPYNFGIVGNYTNINKYESKLQGGQSQNNEDGLLKYIFDTIGIEHKFCIEFGAGDGVKLSNTYYFRKNRNWNCLLLEGNPNLVEQGKSKGENTLYNEVITINNINILFEKYNVPKNIDLLSIDLDSVRSGIYFLI